jgi:GT2 family glycosyltransferase
MITTIIITHNATKWIEACLKSVLSSTIPVRIIVVDNASTDDTPKYIQEQFPHVELLALDTNIGFGPANNLAIHHLHTVLHAQPNAPQAHPTSQDQTQRNASNPPVFLLNQDTRIEPDTLERLLMAMETNPQYGILSPIHLNGTGTDLDRPFRNYLLESDIDPNSLDLYPRTDSPLPEPGNPAQSPLPMRFINAAAWLITPECLQRVGGFHPAFFMYGEDWEYLNRVFHANLEAAIVPGAIMYHDRESRPAKPYEQREANYFEIKTLVTKLHPSLTLWDRFKIISHELFMTFSARFFINPVASIKLLWRKLVILTTLGKRIENAGHPPRFDFPQP